MGRKCRGNEKSILKGLYIASSNHEDFCKTGIYKKIETQVDTFNKHGLETELILLTRKTNSLTRILDKLPFCFFGYKWPDIPKDLDYIYIRRIMAINRSNFLTFLKEIKKKNRNIKIILEIPTFPYDGELKKIINHFRHILLFYEKYNRKYLCKYIDRIATLTEDKEIFGIPTLKFDNGIDFSKYAVRKFNRLNDDTIHMCAVAKFSFWHGYERVFNGLKKYYDNGGKREIIIHMVGDGPEMSKYKNIVKELKINDRVVFHGYLHSEELLNIYNNSLLSLGEFGGYKKKIFDSCSLKSTESLAFGIPFVTGCRCTRLTNKGYKYLLELPNDSSDIDINTIIEFNDKLRKEEREEDIIKNIREFGEKYFSMDACMKNVVDYIKEV